MEFWVFAKQRPKLELWIKQLLLMHLVEQVGLLLLAALLQGLLRAEAILRTFPVMRLLHQERLVQHLLPHLQQPKIPRLFQLLLLAAVL
jgi:hypothetical protein